MRRRATTGVDGTREVGFCFFFGGCSGVGGGFFHMLWSVYTLRIAGGPAGRGALIFCFGDCFTCSGEGVKESSPPSFRTSGAATAVTENNRRELFHPRRRAVSCEAALRILSYGEACPPCGGDSGYFPSAIAK